MSLANNLLLKIEEGVAVSWKNAKRYNKFFELISKKYELGPSKELKVRGSEFYVIKFGPAIDRDIRGKYIYLVVDFQNTKRAKFGSIKQFSVSDTSIVDGFSQDGTNVANPKLTMKPVPKDFVTIDKVMNLVVGASVDFDTDKSKLIGQVLNGPNTDQIVWDINRRFEFMAQLVRTIADGNLPGMIIVGTGGLGKTYTVLSTLAHMGLKEKEDYLHIHGAKVTTTAFYQIIHDNRDKLILFDDTDSVLDDGNVVNMLKSALEVTGERKVSYYSPAIEAMGLEPQFTFTGQIIFISNRNLSNFDQPLKSRSLAVDVTMTRLETFERMAHIINKSPDGPEKEARIKALESLKKYDSTHPGQPKDLNMRTLEKVAKLIMTNPDSEDLIQYVMSVS